jgi:aldehyde:ferredoxin oxidoreductase
MLDEYYQLHGWSIKDGYPTFKTLENLGLGDIANELVTLGEIKK